MNNSHIDVRTDEHSRVPFLAGGLRKEVTHSRPEHVKTKPADKHVKTEAKKRKGILGLCQISLCPHDIFLFSQRTRLTRFSYSFSFSRWLSLWYRYITVLMLTKERHGEHKRFDRKHIYSSNRNKTQVNLVKQ